MDETFTAVTKQVVDDRQGLLLRVGEREYYRYGEDPRWFAQPSGKPVEAETQELLDALEHLATELEPDDPKPLDVDDVHAELLEALRANEECQAEELGRPTTTADRFRLCESELAGQLYGRDDSVAVAAVREALDRPYFDQGTTATLREVYGGTLECC